MDLVFILPCGCGFAEVLCHSKEVGFWKVSASLRDAKIRSRSDRDTLKHPKS